MLFNEPKLLKYEDVLALLNSDEISVLFNEPKLLKSNPALRWIVDWLGFQCSSTSRNC